MNHCQDEMKAAVKAGYWNLFSFNPQLKAEGKNPFTLTSKEGDGSYQAFLSNETRYSALTRKFPERAKVLFDKNLPEAISNGPLGYLGNSKTQLFGAYRVLEYLLGQVSQNRVQDMKQEVKALFDKMPDDIVKQIILQNSGFQLKML